MANLDARPIGVFDSGVGGLTVLRELIQRLPHESTLYLGDTARVPYGTKSGEVVTRYSLRNAEFLVRRDIKLLVVACNTASAVALPALKEALSIPVVGVIEPGARAAAAATRSGRVGVIGTPGTIHSGAYQRALLAQRTDLNVIARSCPLFVPLAEEGWTTGDVPRLIATEYLSPFANEKVDTLVLGCTHYPLLREVIAHAIGPNVTLVDSAASTADEVAALVATKDPRSPVSTQARREYFVTDVPDRFVQVSGRFLGSAIESAHQVDI